ncbi:unnamed protein product [Boreogadus saida]
MAITLKQSSVHSTTQDIDVVWMFAEWALQKNQETEGSLSHHCIWRWPYVNQILQRPSQGRMSHPGTGRGDAGETTGASLELHVLLRCPGHTSPTATQAAQERSHASGPGDAVASGGPCSSPCSPCTCARTPLAAEALELLGDSSALPPPVRVLELLPGAWSVGLVCRYPVGSLRETLHRRRWAGCREPWPG